MRFFFIPFLILFSRYLSVAIALKRPDLISSLSLLNATPVWGLNLPGWSGHLPAPFLPKKIGRYLFDRIRDLNTIETYLTSAYANTAAFDESLMKAIRGCTEGPGGHAAFASILWSPPAQLSNIPETDFYARLSKLQCDVLLLFGKDDPWCKPAFAKKMLTSLATRSNPDSSVQRYVELSNVGHCPNHESPQGVALVLNRWFSLDSTNRKHANLVDSNNSSVNSQELVHEQWGEVGLREVSIEEANQLSLLDKITIKLAS